jgi:GntR family transcriptional repressor for pyruvate dehydrogenase complex
MSPRSARRPPFKIIPIRQVHVYKELLSQLEALIANAGLKPGDLLGSERQLAEQFRVSRVSVREALRTLENMGKVEIRRYSGIYVANPNASALVAELTAGLPIDTAFLNYLVDVRAAIETKVVALVAARSDADLRSIRALLTSIDAEIRRGGGEEGSLDLRFEAALARESSNPLLARVQRLVHQLWVAAWSELGIAPGDRRALHAEHVAIFEALEAGNADNAVELMEEHVDRSVQQALGESDAGTEAQSGAELGRDSGARVDEVS